MLVHGLLSWFLVFISVPTCCCVGTRLVWHTKHQYNPPLQLHLGTKMVQYGITHTVLFGMAILVLVLSKALWVRRSLSVAIVLRLATLLRWHLGEHLGQSKRRWSKRLLSQRKDFMVLNNCNVERQIVVVQMHGGKRAAMWYAMCFNNLIVHQDVIIGGRWAAATF